MPLHSWNPGTSGNSMKRKRKSRVVRRPRGCSSPQPLASAEGVDDSCITIEHVLRMLTGDFYFHRRIHRALSQAGFSVEHLERGKGHRIWLGTVRAAGAELSRDTRLASRELRKVLNTCGFRIKAAELGVYERRKDLVSFSLIFPFGCIGALPV